MSRSRNASVTFILVTLLLDTLGVGLVVPVLPRLFASFLGGDMSTASRYYGVFLAVFAAMQFVCAPIMGGLSDRFGRRPVILSSLLGAAFDYLLLAAAGSVPLLFVGRVVAGVTSASFSAATAYIADITPPEKRAQSFGLVSAALGVGFVLGPALGGLLGGIHVRLPFAAAAGLNLLNCLYGLFILPESLDRERRRAFTLRRANPFSSLRNLGRQTMVLGLSGVLVCSYMAQQILQAVWPLHTQERFGWSAGEIGLSLTAVGVATAVVQGGLVRGIIPWLGERGALLAGAALNAACFAALGLGNRGWMMYAIMIPFALSGVAGPAAQSLVSSQVGPSEQGELQGSLTSLQSLTAIAGPLLATALFSRFSVETAHPRIQGASLFAAAGLSACGFLLAARLFARPEPRGADP